MAPQRQAAIDPYFDGELDGPERGPGYVPGNGPHDVDDLDPEMTLAAGTVDFGAVQVPVPERGTVTVEPTEKGRMQAVHVAVPEGRLSVSALAAPRSSRLWPDLVAEIDASLREGGARVRSFQGDWGRELHATSGAATSVFVGVDGSRWMLYGVATGPTRDARALDEQLRRMMRGTVVVRGRSPYPVRTVLPLEVPEHLVPAAEAAGSVPVEGGSVVEFRRPGHRAAPTGPFPAEQAPPPARPVEATPPATALPAYVPRPVVPVEATVALSVPGVHPQAGHRRAAVDGPDADDRPTEIRPGRVLPQPVAPARGSETAPWSLDPPAVPSAGGRRRLRDPDTGPNGHRPVSPGLTGPWASWPAGPTGPRRPADDRPAPVGVDAPTEVMAAVPEVLRLGRHAARDPEPGPTGRVSEARIGRGAETAPWGAVPQPPSELVTEPLAVVRPAAPRRPSGRHHRSD